MVSALVLLNLAGGEGLDDLDRLEAELRAVPAGAGGGGARAEPAGAAGGGAALAAAAVARAALVGCGGPVACGVSRRRRGGVAASRAGVHPGREPRRSGPVAGERRASADGPGAASGGAGDARHGRYAHRDAKARSALLLQALQGLSAAQHLVGGAGPDRAFGVPRWQRAGGVRAIARSRRGGAPAAGGGEQALSALGHGRLSAGSSQVLRRGQERALRGDRIRRRGGRDGGVQASCGGTARVRPGGRSIGSSTASAMPAISNGRRSATCRIGQP